MTFDQLLVAAGAPPVGSAREIGSLTSDSRAARPGALFLPWPSERRDVADFLPEAAARGAVAAVLPDEAAAQGAQSLGLDAAAWEPLAYPDRAWRLADAFHAHPTREIRVVGVTGTNGKTTVSWLLRDAWTALGERSAYLGTLGLETPEESRELANTTPFAVDLYNLLAEIRDQNVSCLAMEVSSHALAERRADGVEYDVGVFTNLTQDHLDYHGDLASYEAAKWRLFSDRAPSGKPFTAVVNVGDPTGRRWAERLRETPLLTFGAEDADLRVTPKVVAVDHLELGLSYAGKTTDARVPLGGQYNVENAAAAVAALLALGYGLESVAEALPLVRPVPGRFEPVPNDRGIGVIVDYAHTPDALAKLLAAVRSLTPERVVTVFGCGGDRDRTKRPLMAQAASAGSDRVVATSDNPRTEDPLAILREVERGLSGPYEIVPDRAEAIRHALALASPGDVVVIAGKGHENYQIVGREKRPFDDRAVARETLR